MCWPERCLNFFHHLSAFLWSYVTHSKWASLTSNHNIPSSKTSQLHWVSRNSPHFIAVHMSFLPVPGQELSSSSFVYLDLKLHWCLEFSPCLVLCLVFTGELITQFSLLQAELLLRGIEKMYICRDRCIHTQIIYFNLYLWANYADDESTVVIQFGMSKNIKWFWWIIILKTISVTVEPRKPVAFCLVVALSQS